MNLFSVILFIHVMSAIALFIAIAFEGATLARIRAAQNIAGLRAAVQSSRRLGAIYGPAFLGILLGGIYLAAQLHIRAAWVPLALGVTLLMGIISGATTGRKMSRLRKEIERGAAFEFLSGIARSRLLVISYGLRAGIAVGIVYLMSAMPSLVISLVAVTIGAVVGVMLSLRLYRGSGLSSEMEGQVIGES